MTRAPTDWKTVRLEDVAEIRTGLAKGKSYSQATVKVPYLRVANVQDGYLDLTEIKEIEVLPSEVDRYSLKFGDVLLTEGGDFDKLGRGDVWRGEISPCLHQNHVFAVRTKPEFLDPFFFAYQSSSPYGKAYFLSVAKQTTNLASINSTQLKDFPVLLPPLPEQRAIAAILSTWDDAIALTSRLIDALKRRKQALMQRLLTGQTRFPVFEGEEWEDESIARLCEILESGGTPSTSKPEFWDGEIPWITGADFDDLKISQIRRYITPEGIENSSTKVADSGDLLIVSRTGVGKVAIAPFPVAISQDITRAKPNLTKITPAYFLYALVQSIPDLARFNQGTSISGITRDDLKQHAMAVPSLHEQNRISEVLLDCDLQITAVQQSVKRLQTQKRALMQRLLTGQVRVSGVEG